MFCYNYGVEINVLLFDAITTVAVLHMSFVDNKMDLLYCEWLNAGLSLLGVSTYSTA